MSGQGEEDDERPRDRRPGHVPEAELGEPVGKSLTPRGPRTIRARPRKSARVPEGHDQRRQAAAGDEQRRSAGRRATPTTRTTGSPISSGTPAAHRKPRIALGEAGHRLDRQVDLAGDDDQRHRQRHDRDFHQGGDEVREVAAASGRTATAALPSTIRPSSATTSSVSQRASEPRPRPAPVAGAVGALIGCGSRRRRAGAAAG